MSNIDRYKKDIDDLIARGEILHLSIQKEFLPEQFKSHVNTGKLDRAAVAKLPSFEFTYQGW